MSIGITPVAGYLELSYPVQEGIKSGSVSETCPALLRFPPCGSPNPHSSKRCFG